MKSTVNEHHLSINLKECRHRKPKCDDYDDGDDDDCDDEMKIHVKTAKINKPSNLVQGTSLP